MDESHKWAGSDFIDMESLPSNARLIFHPDIEESTRMHVTSLLRCFGGRQGLLTTNTRPSLILLLLLCAHV